MLRDLIGRLRHRWGESLARDRTALPRDLTSRGQARAGRAGDRTGRGRGTGDGPPREPPRASPTRRAPRTEESAPRTEGHAPRWAAASRSRLPSPADGDSSTGATSARARPATGDTAGEAAGDTAGEAAGEAASARGSPAGPPGSGARSAPGTGGRARSAAAAHDSAPPGSPSPAPIGRARLAHFNRRVRLLVEIVDQPEETALARRLFAEQGWSVRSAGPADGVGDDLLAPGTTALVVEVRRRGARVNVCASARHSVRALLREKKLTARLRDATVVEPEPEGDTTTYHVYRTPPPRAGRLLRWVWSHWRAVGRVDTQRTLTLPGAPTAENRRRALAELASRSLGGHPFDPRRQDVRLALAPRPIGSTRQQIRQGVVSLVVLALLLAAGHALHSAPPPWQAAIAATLAALSWPVGDWVGGNEPRPVLIRFSVGASLVGGGAWIGYLWASSRPEGESLADLLLVQGAVGAGVLLAVGLWHAVSNSWFSRNIQWLLPAVLPPLALVLPMGGRILHTLYLSEGFGIPAESVHVPFYWEYTVALEPLGLALMLLLILLGVVGWARYFYWLAGAGELVRFLWPVVMAGFLLTVLQLSYSDVQAAAGETRAAARDGRGPEPYYGIEGSLVCVEPLDEETPVIGGPLPTDRPVLTFGAAEDQLWLWDPHRMAVSPGDAAIRVGVDDVVVTVLPEGRGTACPPPDAAPDAAPGGAAG